MSAGTFKRGAQLGSRYPRQIAWLRVGIGLWLMLVTAVLYSTDHAGEWGWLLLTVAALHFVLAARLFRIARRQRGQDVRFQ
jgi:hypothetical protein